MSDPIDEPIDDPDPLEAAVFDSLDAAVKNGYSDFLKSDSDLIAQDLADCDADLEGIDVKRLRGLVEKWKARN